MTFFFNYTYRHFASIAFNFTIWAFLALILMTFELIHSEDTITANIFILASNFESLIKYVHQILREWSELSVGGIAFRTECGSTLFVKESLPEAYFTKVSSAFFA